MNDRDHHQLPNRNARAQRALLWALLGYFALHVAIRSTAPGTLDIDEAEQVVLAQWLLLGYGPQPPLYTWLQRGLFEVLGSSVFALSVMKNALLFLTYLLTFLAARLLTRGDDRAIIAPLLLMVFPEVVWTAQRDLSHSVLAICLCVAIVYCMLRLACDQRVRMYVLFGILIGMGLLAKYNTLIAVLAIIAGGLGASDTRAALLRPAIVLTLVACCVVIAPHAVWLYHNMDVLREAAAEVNASRSVSILGTLGSLASAVFFILVAPLAIAAMCFGPALRFRIPADHRRLLNPTAYLVASGVLVIAAVIVGDLPHVKARWLLPVIVVLPLLLALHLDAQRISEARMRFFQLLCLIVGIGVLTAMAVRTIGPRFSDRLDRYAIPFPEIAADLERVVSESAGAGPRVILADTALIAGNLIYQYPEAAIFVPYANPGVLDDLSKRDSVVLVWERRRARPMPPALTRFAELKQSEGHALRTLKDVRVRFGGDRYEFALGVAVLDPPRDASITPP